MTDSIYDIEVKTIDGTNKTLEEYSGQVLLFCNVASKCGFTKQYEALEMLYQKYKEKGLVILGFPCNQFLNQEPGSDQDIREFATSCYRVSFPLFAKINVKGKVQHPLYTFLETNLEKKARVFIPWNFTKILVDRDGNVKKHFWPTVSMKNIEKEVCALL